MFYSNCHIDIYSLHVHGPGLTLHDIDRYHIFEDATRADNEPITLSLTEVKILLFGIMTEVKNPERIIIGMRGNNASLVSDESSRYRRGLIKIKSHTDIENDDGELDVQPLYELLSVDGPFYEIKHY